MLYKRDWMLLMILQWKQKKILEGNYKQSY